MPQYLLTCVVQEKVQDPFRRHGAAGGLAGGGAEEVHGQAEGEGAREGEVLSLKLIGVVTEEDNGNRPGRLCVRTGSEPRGADQSPEVRRFWLHQVRRPVTQPHQRLRLLL